MSKHTPIILSESQKITLEFYVYVHKNYDMVFDYLEKIGVDKDDYSELLKQINP